MVDRQPKDTAQGVGGYKLSARAIREYKAIYREEFGEDLSDAEAEE